MKSANLGNSALGAGVVDFGYSVRHFGPIVALHDDLECPRSALMEYFLVSPLNDFGLQMHWYKDSGFSTVSFLEHVQSFGKIGVIINEVFSFGRRNGPAFELMPNPRLDWRDDREILEENIFALRSGNLPINGLVSGGSGRLPLRLFSLSARHGSGNTLFQF